jgi:hypothetical protein
MPRAVGMLRRKGVVHRAHERPAFDVLLSRLETGQSPDIDASSIRPDGYL